MKWILYAIGAVVIYLVIFKGKALAAVNGGDSRDANQNSLGQNPGNIGFFGPRGHGGNFASIMPVGPATSNSSIVPPVSSPTGDPISPAFNPGNSGPMFDVAPRIGGNPNSRTIYRTP